MAESTQNPSTGSKDAPARYAGFTRPLALMGALPLLFLLGDTVLLMLLRPNPLFALGAALLIAGGLCQVVRRVQIADRHEDPRGLLRAARGLRIAGIAAALVSLPLWHLQMDVLREALRTLPSLIFFLTGLFGLATLIAFAHRLPKDQAWAVRAVVIVDGITQALLFLCILFIVI